MTPQNFKFPDCFPGRPALLPLLALGLSLSACTLMPQEPVGPVAKEEIVAVSASHQLLRFNAGQPQNLRERKPLQGLRAGEKLLGIDYRVARGELYALGTVGLAAQLYKLDVAQARLIPVGGGFTLPAGSEAARDWGFDFNPALDRLRVVNDLGQNLRLHPDTGGPVDGDPSTPGVQPDGPLTYEDGSTGALVAAGYTYNKTNDKITTNYALDGRTGSLVHQGSKEGVQPEISPNTGKLYRVGSLGLGPFAHATLDISDLANVAYSGIHAQGAKATRWYQVDLDSGKARFIGTVGGGEVIIGAAIEP